MADPEKYPDFLSDNWYGLPWSSWIPFSATNVRFDTIPSEPGLFRIRAAKNNSLMYIGQTGQPLRQCINEIRQNSMKSRMPEDQPHPVAPALWAWKDAKNYTYECSVTPSTGSEIERKGVRSYLLYRYRQDLHESPACNFGRFHRKYQRSSGIDNGSPGGKLGDRDPLNPSGGPSASPLPATGKPGDPGWMGLSWSTRRDLKPSQVGIVPPQPGDYLIFDAGTREILFIGISENCAETLFRLSTRSPEGNGRQFSFCCDRKPLPAHNRKELGNDLLGNYLEVNCAIPPLQFSEER